MCDLNLKIEATIEKLNVKPGECLILTFPDSINGPPNLDLFNETLKKSLPNGVKWFYVIGDGVKFSVVKKENENS